MDVRQLRYFVEILNQGSLKRASETLHVAQPALSQHVRNLEAELGVALLERSTRGVRPTEAGLRLQSHAQTILRQIAEAADDVRNSAREPRGSVALGLPNSISLVLSVPLVLRVRRDLPKVSLRIVESMSGFIADWLHGGMLDLALLYNFERAQGLTTTRLLNEELYLIRAAPSGGAPPPRRGGAPRSVRMRELEQEDLILPARSHGLRDLIERAAEENGLRLRVAVEIDALTQIKALVVQGAGSSILSQSAVLDELGRGEVEAIRIAEPPIERAVYLAHPRNRGLSHAARAVEGLLVDCIRDLVESGRWHAELLV